MGVDQVKDPQRSTAHLGKGSLNEWLLPSGRGQDCYHRPRCDGQTSLLRPTALLKRLWTLLQGGFSSQKTKKKKKFFVHFSLYPPKHNVSIHPFLRFFFLHNLSKLPLVQWTSWGCTVERYICQSFNISYYFVSYILIKLCTAFIGPLVPEFFEGWICD